MFSSGKKWSFRTNELNPVLEFQYKILSPAINLSILFLLNALQYFFLKKKKEPGMTLDLLMLQKSKQKDFFRKNKAVSEPCPNDCFLVGPNNLLSN